MIIRHHKVCLTTSWSNKAVSWHSQERHTTQFILTKTSPKVSKVYLNCPEKLQGLQMSLFTKTGEKKIQKAATVNWWGS